MKSFLKEKIRIGVIQTTLNADTAWPHGPKMCRAAENLAIKQIRQGFRNLGIGNRDPDIILLPELSTPRGFLMDLQKMSEAREALVIAGLDYNLSPPNCSNEAAVIVPTKWQSRRVLLQPQIFFASKTYPAPKEKKQLAAAGFTYSGNGNVQVFDGGELGRFGVVICYDLTDIERLVLYRAQLDSLFVLAYNKDMNSFRHIAEAVMRLNFHNVAICNTGHFGGSFCVSPYYDPHRREVFSLLGQNLFASQTFEIEIADLSAHQKRVGPAPKPPKWKALPPGFPDTGNEPPTLQFEKL